MSAVEQRFGPYGGRYVPETLIAALDELTAAWEEARDDPGFNERQDALRRDFIGRPTPLYLADRLSERVGSRVYLKREDLAHTGAHKINNALGQTLLAERMGKQRIIAETGAGQHGVATATACALLGLECVVYMGTEDIRRQAPNVERMKLLGAEVAPVEAGARTLKEAVSAAIRDWVANVETTHYVIGSAVGPAPYPALVRDLQRVIGEEAREQTLAAEGALPRRVIACVGGGSNAIGIFAPFVDDAEVALVGVEAGGDGIDDRPPRRLARRRADRRAARLALGGHRRRGGPDPRGPLGLGRARLSGHGPRARLPARHRPRLLLRRRRRRGARARCGELARLEGIIPALESSHAIAWLLENPLRGGRLRRALPLRPRRQGPCRVRSQDRRRVIAGEERIRAAFAAAKDEGRAALMPYMMAGFPDRDSGLAVARGLRRRRRRSDRARGAVLGPARRRSHDPLGGDPGARRGRDAADRAGDLRGGRRPGAGGADGLREHGAGARRRRPSSPSWRAPPAPPGRSSPTCRWARPRTFAKPSPRPGSRWCRWSPRPPRRSGASEICDVAHGLRLRRLHRRDDRRARRDAGRARRAGRRHQGRRGGDPGRGRLRDRHRRAGRGGRAGWPTG